MAAGWISAGRSTRRTVVGAGLAVASLVSAACGGAGDLARIPLGGTGGAREASSDARSLSMLFPSSFVLADGVDIAASEAEAWRWEAPGVDEVTELAGRLGVTGSPVEVPADQGGGWIVGDPASEASLNVSAGGPWSASSLSTSPTVVSSDDCDGRVVVDVEPAASEGGPVVTTVDESSVCEEIENEVPPVLPSDEEVLATVTTIFGDGVTARVDWRDEWSVSVGVEYSVDGRSSGQLGYYATYGSGWYASGILGAPVGQGRYPTISAADAVARLTDSPLGMGLVRGAGAVATPAVQRNDVAEPPPTEPAVEPAPTFEPISGEDESVPAEPGLVPEPMPSPEPLPEPMSVPGGPTEVVLISVAATLVPFFDGTGAVWSLPGYVYTDAEGGEWEVVAVADEYFEEPADLPVDVAVDPPVDGDEPVTDDGSGGGVVRPSPGDGGSGVSEPNPGVAVPDVLGLTEADATVALEEAGYSVRVAERDGEMFMLTRDYRSDRVNLTITGGVVTSASVG